MGGRVGALGGVGGGEMNLGMTYLKKEKKQEPWVNTLGWNFAGFGSEFKIWGYAGFLVFVAIF